MNKPAKRSISLKYFIEKSSDRIDISPLSVPRGFKKKITSIRVQKPGLRIIEDKIKLEKGKVQILGKTEISYINNLPAKARKEVLSSMVSQDVPCYIIAKGVKPSSSFLKHFKNSKIPLFKSSLSTGMLISELNDILGEEMAPMVTFHGVLMDIQRLGVLILGKSGIGKSECALDLITKGSKLIADDVVEIRQIPHGILIGTGPENIKYLMEIRGIGIVNIRDLFGRTSVMDKRQIDFVIELDQWEKGKEYERLGMETKSFTIIDVKVPYVVIPVSPGRNIATVIEVAVRNQILKNSGIIAPEFNYQV